MEGSKTIHGCGIFLHLSDNVLLLNATSLASSRGGASVPVIMTDEEVGDMPPAIIGM